MAKRSEADWIRGVNARENARHTLPGLVQHFLQTGDAAAGRTPADTRRLHKFRLETKRLRYTLELFRPCYDEGLEHRIDNLKEVQDVFGDMQDSAAASRLIKKKMRKGAERREWLAKFKARAQEKIQHFHQVWTTHFAGPENHRDWIEYFSNPASVRKPPAEDGGARVTANSAAG